MKGKLSTKAIVIIILTIVLLAIAITGSILFLRDSGRAEAMSEENLSERLPVAGTDQVQNEEQPAQENNDDEIEIPEVDNDTNTNNNENVEEQEDNTTTETTTISEEETIETTEDDEESQIELPAVSTVEQERVVAEQTNLSWDNININSVSSNNINVNELEINYKNLKYTVEYYFDGNVDTELTEIIGQNEKGKIIETYEDKILTGYKLDKVENLPLTITENEETNVIKVYYIKDESQTKDLSYTVEYYKDDVKVEEETVTETVWVNEKDELKVTTTIDNNKYLGYAFKETNPQVLPETIENGEKIKVYYIKDESQTKDLSYTVEYYKDNVKVEEETVEVTVWINDPDTLEVTTIVNNNKYLGYEFKETDPQVLPETIENGETIKVYYIKDESQTKDLSYKVEYYKDNVKVEEETVTETVWVNEEDELKVTTTVNNNKYDGYIFKKTEPETLPETIKNGETIKIYYEARTDIKYTINYYKEGADTPFYTDNTLVGTFGKSVTVSTDQINSNKPDGFSFDRRDPAQIVLGTDESKNILNIYYKADMQQYEVNYYLEGTTTKLEESKIGYAKTETLVREEAVEIEGYNKLEPQIVEIEIKEGKNEINFYYTARIDISYTVNYYKDGTTEKLADSKVGSGKTFKETVTETAKDITGYTPTETTKTLVLDKVSGNEINFYYTIRTDLSYTVKYFYNGIEDPSKEYTVQNQTFGTVVNDYEDKSEGGWTLESATTPITIGIANNVIKVYYTKSAINVIKTSDKTGENIKYGDIITYKITATNTGLKEGEVKVTDSKLKELIDGGKVTVNSEYTELAEELIKGKTITVPANNSVEISFKVTVIANAGEKIENTITVDGGTNDQEEEVISNIEKLVSITEKTEGIKGKNIILTMDFTTSIIGNLSDEKKVICDFIDSIYNDESTENPSTITVVRYSHGESLVVDHAGIVGTANSKNDAESLKKKVNNLRVLASGVPTGYTDIKYTLQFIKDNCLQNGDVEDNIVIFMGDGIDTESSETEIGTIANELKQRSKVYTLGVDVPTSGRYAESARNLMEKIIPSSSSDFYESSYANDLIFKTMESLRQDISKSNYTLQSTNGKVELNGLYVDNSHPIIINGTTYTSIPDKIVLDNGKYYLDLTKFGASEEVSIIYYSR